MKKNIIITIAIIAILITVGVAWVLHQKQEQSAPAELPQQETSQQEQPVASEAAQTNNQEQVSEEPQPTIDTSDWKTYRNEEYGFSIKYPGDWQVELYNEKTIRRYEVEKDVPRTIKLILKKEYGDPAVKKEYSSIVIQFTDWFDIAKDFYTGDKPKDLEFKMITVGGRTAIILDNKFSNEDIKTDYEAYLGKEKCPSKYIFSMKPAPKGRGEFNTILVNSACDDINITKNMIESINFFE